MPFKDVPSTVDFIAQEHAILDFWRETNAFQRLRELRAGGPRWSFLDGPITANNPAGVHHAWGRTYKDLWQRFKAMQGFDQRWQNGYDCQGLWVEVNVERELGFKSKRDIESFGIAEFVKLCKQRVLTYAAIITEQSIRLGQWMDWDDPDRLRWLRDKLGENPMQVVTVQGPFGPVTDTVEQIVGRLGLPELGGSYYTFSNENNYQIWSFLKRCWERGWIYKGHDVMPWCPRCGTGISQHEIVTEGYVERTDPGLTVRFPLRERPGESLLVWTTTPWTLTSNVAAAVGPNLTYLRVRQGDAVFYLSKGTTHMLSGDYEVLGELPGSDMEGWTYAGPFDDLPAQQASGSVAAHRVVLWEEVGEEEGTGIVHIAPGCGAEDFQLSKRYNLPVIAPLDENGVYGEGFAWLTGMNVGQVTEPIVEDLKRKGLFYRLEPYTHRYPVCWRCQTPLVFRLVDEWFISMGEVYDKPREELTPEEKARSLRYQMMDVTEQIRWIPEFGLDREMDWLRNMHDWMISKKRYWGLALPIWECHTCGHFEVIGSEEELRQRAVEGWETFQGHTPHRPWVDAVKIRCANCGALASRIADVGNPWLDAGIVPYSTLRYRTDRAYWEKWFPADFITESFPGQFRNWFYSLLAMSTVLENRPPFKTVLGYATLLGADGRPMHKSWGNAIEFHEAAEQIGVDVMRWMFCAHRPEKDLWFGYGLADETRRRFLIPLWNVYSFFVTYANLDGWEPQAQGQWATPPAPPEALNRSPVGLRLDRWILARLNQVVAEVTERLEDYDAASATRAIEVFLEDLSNWYVRRSRRRFWKSEHDSDKQAAYSTLYYVLVTLARLLAPFVPFVTEALYQNLVRQVAADAPLSVHHCDWPQATPLSAEDATLLGEMALARQVVAAGHAARAAAGLKVRQPLARAIVVTTDEQRPALAHLEEIIEDELNVKSLEPAAQESELVAYRLLPDLKKLGPKLGALTPKVRAALAGLNEAQAVRYVAALRAGQRLALSVDGGSVELAPDEVLIQTEPKAGYAIASEGGVTVALDTVLTPELEAEGLAREVIRRIQDLRKSAGFNIADHIITTYRASPRLAAAMAAWAETIAAETLSDTFSESAEPAGQVVERFQFDGEEVVVGLRTST
jgi:isoleucyl-tRNA synthetase